MGIEIRRVSRSCVRPLSDFFHALASAGDDLFFHPHPLTSQAAAQIAAYSGKDLYYTLLEGHQVLAYGMLRGWDEGYDIPSLGVALHPEARGTGLGEMFMRFLHAAAQRKGARAVRLTVHPANVPAVRLYTRLGYRLEAKGDELLVGFVDLGPESTRGRH